MKKHPVLISWIGATDLRAVNEPGTVGIGPIAQALIAYQFDQVVLLSDYSESLVAEALWGPGCWHRHC